jgi:hypothetical protein
VTCGENLPSEEKHTASDNENPGGYDKPTGRNDVGGKRQTDRTASEANARQRVTAHEPDNGRQRAKNASSIVPSNAPASRNIDRRRRRRRFWRLRTGNDFPASLDG